MITHQPLFLLPDELWQEIILTLNLYSLRSLSLTCQYFYHSVQKRFSREYNTIIRIKESIFIPLSNNKYTEYKRMVSPRGPIFSHNNIVLLYDRHERDIADTIFTPFITSIHSYQEFLFVMKKMRCYAKFDEDYLDPNIPMTDAVLELAKISAIENIVRSVHRIKTLVPGHCKKTYFTWGILTKNRLTTACINLYRYSDVINRITKEMRKTYLEFHIEFENTHPYLCFDNDPHASIWI